jgi:hypothetical protein
MVFGGLILPGSQDKVFCYLSFGAIKGIGTFEGIRHVLFRWRLIGFGFDKGRDPLKVGRSECQACCI